MAIGASGNLGSIVYDGANASGSGLFLPDLSLYSGGNLVFWDGGYEPQAAPFQFAFDTLSGALSVDWVGGGFEFPMNTGTIHVWHGNFFYPRERNGSAHDHRHAASTPRILSSWQRFSGSMLLNSTRRPSMNSVFLSLLKIPSTRAIWNISEASDHQPGPRAGHTAAARPRSCRLRVLWPQEDESLIHRRSRRP